MPRRVMGLQSTGSVPEKRHAASSRRWARAHPLGRASERLSWPVGGIKAGVGVNSLTRLLSVSESVSRRLDACPLRRRDAGALVERVGANDIGHFQARQSPAGPVGSQPSITSDSGAPECSTGRLGVFGECGRNHTGMGGKGGKGVEQDEVGHGYPPLG